MFLNYLKEESKENFLKLCLAAAQANNVIEKEEEQLMYAYCKELGIKEQIPSGDIDVESVLSELKEKTNIIEKRVISLEILGLMYSDGEYDSSEKEFVDELVNKFEITKDELEKIDKLLNEYSEVYKKMVSEKDFLHSGKSFFQQYFIFHIWYNRTTIKNTQRKESP